MKVILITILAVLPRVHAFSMDLMTEHAMKSVVIQIASKTVDSKNDVKNDPPTNSINEKPSESINTPP